MCKKNSIFRKVSSIFYEILSEIDHKNHRFRKVLGYLYCVFGFYDSELQALYFQPYADSVRCFSVLLLAISQKSSNFAAGIKLKLYV